MGVDLDHLSDLDLKKSDLTHLCSQVPSVKE